jgi:hypothetical protein
LIEVDWSWRFSYPAELVCDPDGLTMLSKAGWWPPIYARRALRWDDIDRISLRESPVGRYINVHGKHGHTLRMRVADLNEAATTLRAIVPPAVPVDLQRDRGRRVRLAEIVTLGLLVTVIVTLIVFAVLTSQHR